MNHATAIPASSGSQPEQPHKRRYRSVSERRRIVEQSLAPGVNVKRVAEANGIRANQLFKWRRQYRDGRLGSVTTEPMMLPVRIKSAKKSKRKQVKRRPTSAAPNERSGTIRIELSGCSVTIDGIVDPNTLNLILERLAL